MNNLCWKLRLIKVQYYLRNKGNVKIRKKGKFILNSLKEIAKLEDCLGSLLAKKNFDYTEEFAKIQKKLNQNEYKIDFSHETINCLFANMLATSAKFLQSLRENMQDINIMNITLYLLNNKTEEFIGKLKETI